MIEFEVNGRVVESRNISQDQLHYEITRFKAYAERNGLNYAVYIRKRSKGNNRAKGAMTIADISKATAMRAAGHTWQQIADEMKLHELTVRRTLKECTLIKT